MKVKFMYPRQIDGVSYSAGEHDVPDSLNGHWFFLAMLANNEVVKVGEKSDVNPHPMGSKAYHEYQAAWTSQKEAKEKAAKDAAAANADPLKKLGAESTASGGESKPAGDPPAAPAQKAPVKKAGGKKSSKKVVSKEPVAAKE